MARISSLRRISLVPAKAVRCGECGARCEQLAEWEVNTQHCGLACNCVTQHIRCTDDNACSSRMMWNEYGNGGVIAYGCEDEDEDEEFLVSDEDMAEFVARNQERGTAYGHWY